MSEEEEAEARAELADTMKKHLPNTFRNLSTAVLIWLFGVLVYLPAARRIESTEVPLICGLTVLIGFSVFVFRGFDGFRCLLDASSDVLAYEYRRRRKKVKASIEQLKTVTRCVVFVVAALIIYGLYSPLLAAIYPSLSGLMLVLVILWIFWMIFRVITTLTAGK
ncbi:MAG: hypothetical protein U9O89_07740 [Thermoproteota archaeon]|nr:hypothetical protein [Thermoproteota archaeon]